MQARTELAKIYQHQNKYDEAEKILLELLSIEKRSFYAMAELIYVYNKMDKPEKCFQLFDKFLYDVQIEKKRKPQAMFNNIFKLCAKYRKSDKAKEYFSTYSKILDERNILLYKQLFS
ncbi:MAG: hypothetical protein A2V66_11590 [Ignavibacteria bacterium RBG_13_36_8]|nr:MAG: hypothetical protein A2V66_11590 [Ignavibacteria bacterium RBG_13_36_8]